MPSKKQRRAAAQEKRARTLELKKKKAWKDTGRPLSCARHSHAVCAVGTKLYALGGSGEYAKDRVVALETFDTLRPDDGWTEAQGRGLGRRAGVSAAVIGTKIYAVGGYGRSGTLDTVAVFDTAQPAKAWKTMPQKLNKARSSHAACAVGTKIYVVGGCQQLGDGHGGPEVFDTEHPEEGWKYLAADLKTRERLGLGLAAIGSKIYALGGYVRGYAWNPLPSAFSPKNSVEVYDTAHPDEGWQVMPCMHCARKFFGVGIVGTKLYAVGGDTGSGPRDFVEVYNTAQHMDGEWTIIQKMTQYRQEFDVGVVEGKIFAVGGCCEHSHTKDTILNTMEVVDTTIGTKETVVPGSEDQALNCSGTGGEKRQRLV